MRGGSNVTFLLYMDAIALFQLIIRTKGLLARCWISAVSVKHDLLFCEQINETYSKP